MTRENTKQRILLEAVKLFAKKGFEAVTVEMIAAAVGIKAPSLYKHYKGKQDIFESVLKEMERRDYENASDCSLPVDTKEAAPQTYDNISVNELVDYCKLQFRYWTEDEFASSFRKMLTVEQYRSEEMNSLYHQYLCTGPLNYIVDLLGSYETALELYSPMFLLYSVYDNADDRNAVYQALVSHLDKWMEKWMDKRSNRRKST